MRQSKIERKTTETEIKINFNLDGSGRASIKTGIGFLDHMLTLFAFHGNFDLDVYCNGDLQVDDHHTVEDIALSLGQAFKQALGDKIGIKRYSSLYIPMDECLCRTVIDISNRPHFVYKVDYSRERVGTLDTQNVAEFFKSFVNEARITLHIELLYGGNDHHKVEAIFKSFARCLNEATMIDSNQIRSTKGVL
ncbi:imidazoleglycerol-phosphate dehydratase HisB [Haloplasma contractile]|nr:imidazoleglycerol-phosphate dehydratase HisB [Haloplasma contractile]